MTRKRLRSDANRKHGPARRRAPETEMDVDTPQREPSTRAIPVLTLQHHVGNATVQKLLHPAAPPAIGLQRASIRIQRTPDAVQQTHGYVTVPDLRVGARLLGPSLRSKMRAVVRQGRESHTKRNELDGLVEYLKMAAEANGPAAAQSVSAAQGTAKGLSGSRRESLEEAIDKYNTAKPRLRGIMSEVEAARATIVASTKKLESRVLGKKLLETHREKEKVESDLKGLEEKRASTNKILSGFISFSEMLINPSKGWSTALSTAASMVGNYIEDLALGGTYAQQIAAVRQKLSDLTQSIKGIEDAQALAEIEAAAAELKAAQHILEARLNELAGAVYAAEVAQDDIQMELKKLGKRGKQAAAALMEGSAVIETGNEALAKSMALQSALELLKTDIDTTLQQSNDYRQWVELDGSNLSRDERVWAREAAIKNVRAAQSWNRWADGELAYLAEHQKFLMGRSYLVGYEQGVETALTKIRRG